MLAHGQGTLLAAGLQISAPTVLRHIDLLVELPLVRRLLPFLRNMGKRPIKSPKIYVRDSGLVHALLRIRTHNDWAARRDVLSMTENAGQ
jgi:predicted AAA+ superfamily ATPase